MTREMTPYEIERRAKFAARVRDNAISVRTNEGLCKNAEHNADGPCVVTWITTAMILTHGSTKAHRIVFSNHSVDPDSMARPAGPSCGSKRIGLDWVSAGRFVPAVTCGRC